MQAGVQARAPGTGDRRAPPLGAGLHGTAYGHTQRQPTAPSGRRGALKARALGHRGHPASSLGAVATPPGTARRGGAAPGAPGPGHLIPSRVRSKIRRPWANSSKATVTGFSDMDSTRRFPPASNWRARLAATLTRVYLLWR